MLMLVPDGTVCIFCASITFSGRGAAFKSRGMCFVVPGNEEAPTVLHVVH